jgi:hypothetical protein
MQNLQTTPYRTRLFTELAKHNIYQYDEEKYLYKYVVMETARRILGNHSMRFSTSIELKDNDLDSGLLYHNYPQKYIQQQQKKLFNDSLKEDFKDELQLHNRKARRNFLHTDPLGKAMKNKFNGNVIVDEHLKAFEDQKNTIGIFCATKSSDKKEMWESKYADFEKGFCIEYKFPSLYNDVFNGFTVNYDDEMKPLNYLDRSGKQDNISIYRWLFTKKSSYKWEDEIRLISKKDKVGIYIVPIEMFAGLYYGKKTPPEHIEELELILKEGGYSFTKAIKAIY